MATRQRTDIPRKGQAMTTTTTDDTVQAPRVGRYQVDSQGSTITFRSRHLFGLAPVHGTMAISGGLVDIADPITDSSVQVEIDTTSFHTGSHHRDRDVRSPRFLDAARYPWMTSPQSGWTAPTAAGRSPARCWSATSPVRSA
jgi:polyisoprenoid-binding protein YceI